MIDRQQKHMSSQCPHVYCTNHITVLKQGASGKHIYLYSRSCFRALYPFVLTKKMNCLHKKTYMIQTRPSKSFPLLYHKHA